MKKTNGFTLVELLVVISIIAIMLAILMPSLSKAREQGRRVVCANNLKTMAMGDILYSQDSDGWHVPIFSYIANPATDVTWFRNKLFMKIIGMTGRKNTETVGNNQASTLPQEYKCPTDKRTVANGGLYRASANEVQGTSYGMNSVGLRAMACGNGWCRVPNKPHTLKVANVVRPVDKFFFMDSEWAYVWYDSADYLRFWDKIGDKMTADEFDMPAYRHKEGANMVFYDGHVKWMSKKEIFKVDLEDGFNQFLLNKPSWFPIGDRKYIDPPYN